MIRLNKMFPCIVIVLLFLIPAITQDPYILFILSQIFIWATMSASLWITIKTGIFNLGHSAFMSIGAYASALLTTKSSFSFWLTLPIGASLAAIIALFISVPILRLKGMYFVLITCSLCEVIKLLIASFPKVTGGYNGVWNIPAPKLAFIDFSNNIAAYYLILIFMVVSVFICYRFWASQIGKIFKGIAANELLGESVGIPTTKYKILSFVVASMFASLCGSFITVISSTIDPVMFGIASSTNCFLYMVFGGTSSISGPIIGTAAAIIINEIFRFALEITPAIFGLLIIGTLFLFPGGLIMLPKEIGGLIRRKISQKSIPLAKN